MSAKSPSPPSSPRVPGSPRTSSSRLSLYSISQAFIRMKRIRDHKQIESSSGQQPITHPSLVGAVHLYKEPINRGDQFICVHGVDLPKLLRASRLSLLNQAKAMGANVLVDEKWNTTIFPPKDIMNGQYKVQVQYSASATKSDKRDPGRPVALDQAKAGSLSGLMTILEREG